MRLSFQSSRNGAQSKMWPLSLCLWIFSLNTSSGYNFAFANVIWAVANWIPVVCKGNCPFSEGFHFLSLALPCTSSGKGKVSPFAGIGKMGSRSTSWLNNLEPAKMNWLKICTVVMLGYATSKKSDVCHAHCCQDLTRSWPQNPEVIEAICRNCSGAMLKSPRSKQGLCSLPSLFTPASDVTACSNGSKYFVYCIVLLIISGGWRCTEDTTSCWPSCSTSAMEWSRDTRALRSLKLKTALSLRRHLALGKMIAVPGQNLRLGL